MNLKTKLGNTPNQPQKKLMRVCAWCKQIMEKGKNQQHMEFVLYA